MKARAWMVPPLNAFNRWTFAIAKRILDRQGLSIVKLTQVADTVYLVKNDGTHLRLMRGKKP